MSQETARSQPQREAFQKEVLWPPNSLQPKSSYRQGALIPWEEQSREAKDTLHCVHGGPPTQSLTHLVTSSGALHCPLPLSRALHRRKNLPPHPGHSSPPHTYGANKEHGTPWFRKKTGNRKRGWFGPQLPGQVSPRPPLPPSTPVPSEFPRCATVLLCCWLMAHINRGSTWVRGGSGGKA